MARNLTTGLQRGLRRSIAGGLGASDLFSVASLDLRFAQQKTLDPRITFTRASGGTYVGSDGLIKTATTNEARFDHNPTTGESLGLLVEEQRTNLLLRSEEFGTWWTALRASVSANATTSPSGSLTADTVIEDTTATNSHQIYSGSAQGAGTYTVSIYAKAAGRSVFQIQQESGGNSRFTLTGNGTAEALGANTVSITSVGNGWYRCTSTYTATGAHLIYLVLHNGTTTFYTGDGVSGIHFWGAMLESGSFPTSYIPTTTATVTRSADVASITGANFSSWYNQTEGTVFWEGNPFASTETGYFGLQDAGSTSFVRLSRSFNQARNVVSVSSVGQADLFSGNSITLGANNRLATAIKANDFALSLAGATVVTDTSGTMPTVDRATIGTGAFVSQLNGTIRRLTYWPSRLPNATLQQITR